MADRPDDPSPPGSTIGPRSPDPLTTDAGRALTMFANQTDWLRTMATGIGPHLDRSRVWTERGLIAALTGSTGVLILDSERHPDTETIDRGLTFLRERGCGDVLVWSAVEDPSLDLTFLSRGCTDSFSPSWMWRDLPLDAPESPGRSLSPEITIGIADEADRRDIAAATSLPYVSSDLIHTAIDLATVPERERRVWIVLARKGRSDGDARVIGMTAVNLIVDRGHVVAALFNLAVDERERRQGIGTALTRAACEITASWGAIGIGLNATPDGERVYRALGFRDTGSGQTWFLTGDRLRSLPNARHIAWAELLGRGQFASLTPPAQDWTMPNGESPLAFAARFGQTEAARWLTSHGAGPEIGPLWRLGMREEARTAAREPCYRDARRHPGETTPLHEAILAGDEELARMLIAAGADLTIRDGVHHGTPLRWAEVLGQSEITAMISEVGGTN